MRTNFSINYDYRCPFARNANEHVVAALAAGAEYDVSFLPFSLSQVHLGDGETSIFERPDGRPDLLALAASVVIRERFPDQFLDSHLRLFAARHDEGLDVREEKVVRDALDKAGVDVDAVFAELASAWPYEVVGKEHESAVRDHDVFGVPTFVLGDRAVFVRLMTRPSDADARATIDHVLSLLADHPELNEFKQTSIPR